MALYNNGFPVNYPQMYYQPPMVQPIQQQQMQPQIQQQQTQQQYPVVHGGFVRVMNENEARMYPVAPGNSVTFIDENAPYCYTKTVDLGQLDRPKFEKYRLVKEDDEPTTEKPQKQASPDLTVYALKTDVEAFQSEIDAIKSDIEAFRGDLYGLAGKKKPVTKKEGTNE